MRRNNDQTAAAQQLVEKARALHALSCLMQLVVTARSQADIATWQKVGGLEAEDFLHAVEHGLPHPLLSEWQRRKTENRRPGPNLRERHFRHLAVLMSVALQRAGLDKHKQKARTRVGEALSGLIEIGSHRTVERWELQQELTPEDEGVINAALRRCGSSHEAIVQHFVGFIRFPHDTVRRIADPDLFPPISGDGNVVQN